MKHNNLQIQDRRKFLAMARRDVNVARRVRAGKDCWREFSHWAGMFVRDMLTLAVREDRILNVWTCADLASLRDFARRESVWNDNLIADVLWGECSFWVEQLQRQIERLASDNGNQRVASAIPGEYGVYLGLRWGEKPRHTHQCGQQLTKKRRHSHVQIRGKRAVHSGSVDQRQRANQARGRS